jgi:hypothetical protein
MCFLIFPFSYISGSEKAGKKLLSVLSLGSSKPWKEAIKVMTSSEESASLDPSALREYFSPLEQWLTDENVKNGVKVGWRSGNGDFEKFCDKKKENEN